MNLQNNTNNVESKEYEEKKKGNQDESSINALNETAQKVNT